MRIAEIAQLVERNLAKVEVAGPSPVFRSQAGGSSNRSSFFVHWRAAEIRIKKFITTRFVAQRAYLCRKDAIRMTKINQIRRLAIIVAKLNSRRYVPAEELVDYVTRTIRMRYSEPAGCTLRTLQRAFETIEELFRITIRNDKLRGYYIAERYGSAGDYEALLNFELLHAIDADSAIQKYVLAEHRRAVILPDVAELLDAIRNRHPVEFDYTLVRHGGKVVHKCLHPHFLKVSQQRWYLIGYDADGKLKCFGLDRLSSLRVLSRERFERNETIIILNDMTMNPGY